MMRIWTSLCFVFFFGLGQAAHAQSTTLEKALREFNQGSYAQALTTLSAVRSTDKNIIATTAYLRGISHARLQQFTRASQALIEASKLNHQAKDLYYELGQALYARNQLPDARAAFARSLKQDHMTTVSLYYMAHISQILYEHDQAIKFYDEILKRESNDKSMRQVARFQKTEVELLKAEELTENIQKKLVTEKILPELQLALKEASETPAETDIKRRIAEIQDKFGLDPNKMANGRFLPLNPWTINYTHKFRYDDNITLANDQPTVVSTLKDSFITDGTFFASYQKDYFRRISLIPEIRLQKLFHHDRGTSEVYTNDRYTITPGIRARHEHQIFGRMAATLVQAQFDYTAQDKFANKDLGVFARSVTLGIGEKIKLFSFGETTFTFKRRTFRAYLASLDNDTMTYSVDQVVILPNRHLAVLIFQYDDTDNFNAPNNSTSSMLFRADYIITNLMPKLNLNLGLGYTILDPKLQKTTRGTEPSWNPSIKLSHYLTEKLRIGFEYNYTTKTSLETIREYTKHSTGLELRYDY